MIVVVVQIELLNTQHKCAPGDSQLWCVFHPRFALSKEGFCFKLITVRRIFIKSTLYILWAPGHDTAMADVLVRDSTLLEQKKKWLQYHNKK